jgi:hypothetical protein
MGASFVSSVVRCRLQHKEVKFVMSGCVNSVPGAPLGDRKGRDLANASILEAPNPARKVKAQRLHCG